MNRSVQPEILDRLPADDPEAVQSRKDLRRLNRIMGNARILSRAISALIEPPQRIVEIGAGSGTLLLEALRNQPRPHQGAEVVFLDLVDLLTPEVRDEYAAIGWTARVVVGDVRETLSEKVDLILANLFLHHFKEAELGELLSQIREHTDSFFCVEPRRSWTAHIAASLVGVIGCNRVTRHDAVVSVRAGFRDHELSELWGKDHSRALEEKLAPPFSHFFLATPKS